MIETLSIERFKSVQSLAIRCARVNVFIGPPDTGKTNLLEALYLGSRLGWALPLDNSLRLRAELGFDQLFHRQFFDQPIRIFLRPSVDIEIAIAGGQNRMLSVKAAVPRVGSWENSSMSFGTPFPVPAIDWLRFYSYIGSEHWQYSSGFHRGTDAVTPPYGQNLLYIARHNHKVYEFLKEDIVPPNWKLRFDQVQKTFRFLEIRQDEVLDYNLDLLSDSLKRYFFYATIILTSERTTLVFDEPDVYAFPPYPKRLGEMIAADKLNQYFLTTHNPYFLAALAEKTPIEELAIFVCARDDEGGTTATHLNATQVSQIIEQGASVFFNLGAFLPS
jgi:predicted ATPase